MKKTLKYITIFPIAYLMASCTKETEFLEAKPDVSLIVPTKLQDFQLLLYREDLFNGAGNPGLGTITTDEYYVTPQEWMNASVKERNAYIFGKGDIYENDVTFADWNIPYNQIYVANTVLGGIEKIKITTEQLTQYNQIKGQALFFRSHAFYNLVQTYALPYDSAIANSLPGIPLRVTSDFNIKVPRATIKECYDRILQDLTISIELLPQTTQYPTQPSKIAANALLARIYLAMRNYSKALQFANATLGMNNTLTDYNTLTPASRQLSTTYLKEDIFHTALTQLRLYSFVGGSMVDSVLYSFYDNPNDLRKTMCYIINSGRVEFRGTYAIKGTPYCGLATNEMYLIRAECNARVGNVTAAMSDVNTLLRARWKKNGTVSTYIDQTTSSSANALNIIFKERRKELPFRGLRWTDIRRLNQEPGYQTTLVRVFNGITYTLPPGDPRFAMPIPLSEIQLTGIQQNGR